MPQIKIKNLVKVAVTVTVTLSIAFTLNIVDDNYFDQDDPMYLVVEYDQAGVPTIVTVRDTVRDTVYTGTIPADEVDEWIKIPGTDIWVWPK